MRPQTPRARDRREQGPRQPPGAIVVATRLAPPLEVVGGRVKRGAVGLSGHGVRRFPTAYPADVYESFENFVHR